MIRSPNWVRVQKRVLAGYSVMIDELIRGIS